MGSPTLRSVLAQRLGEPLFARTACLICLVTAAASAFLVPGLVSPWFNGPEGTRWVAPFTLWMGTVVAVFLLLAPRHGTVGSDPAALVPLSVVTVLGALFLFVAAQRLTSGLRFLESIHHTMVLRFAAGGPLYPDPEVSAVGSMYTPFYYLVCGAIHRLLPGVCAWGRVVSVLATGTTAWVVYRIILFQGGRAATGFWGAGLFLGTYGILGQMYDLVEVDPTLMCLLALSLMFFIRDTPRGDMWALLPAGAACFTKQTGAVPFIVILGFSLAARRKPGYYLPLALWGLVATASIAVTNGKIIDHVVSQGLRHPWRAIPPREILVCFFALQLPLWIGGAMGWRKASVRFAALGCALLLISLFGVWKAAGWINALFPFEPVLCVLAAHGLAGRKILLAGQLVLGLYNPFAAIYPWSTVRDPARRAVAMAQAVPGEVWFPTEAYLAYEAGKREWDHFGGLESRYVAGFAPPQRLVSALGGATFDLVVMLRGSLEFVETLDTAITGPLWRNYRLEPEADLTVLKPISGRGGEPPGTAP